MSEKTVNIHDAATQPSRLSTQVELGAPIVIAGSRKAVAELRPARKVKKCSSPLDDPLFRAKEYNYDGPIGPTANADVDSTIYGI